jgi:hypothetical protein
MKWTEPTQERLYNSEHLWTQQWIFAFHQSGNFLISWITISCSKETLHHGVRSELSPTAPTSRTWVLLQKLTDAQLVKIHHSLGTWHLKVHYHIHNSLPMVPIPSQMNPVHIHFNIIFLSKYQSHKWPFPSCFLLLQLFWRICPNMRLCNIL